MTSANLTQKRLKELLHYDQDTGVFTGLVDRCFKASANKIAGSRYDSGYIYIAVDGKRYYAHRLAFYYMDGTFPPDQVDHINRAKDDNRWSNLRHADSSINNCNRSNNVAFPGVNWDKQTGKWKAQINKKHIGRFTTHLAACYARHSYQC